MVSRKKITRSVKSALLGFAHAFRGEQNFRIHVIITGLVLFASWFFKLTPMEFIAIAVVIGLVLALELVNTAMESLIDLVHIDSSPSVGAMKDLLAAAVLISAIISAVVGGIIFYPHVIALF